jgi:tetratricopeptide (TPR) repeat protein
VKTTKIGSCVIAVGIGLWGSAAWADSLCPDLAQQAAADAQVKQAEALDRAGKAREAYGAAKKANFDCVTDSKGHEALLKRTAKVVGAEEEKKGKLNEAFEWYEHAQSEADAGRMQRKMVESKPNDMNTVSHAIDYFRNHNDAAQEKAMRAHALKNVEKALTAEEKSFASVAKNSLTELGLAKDWSYYAQAGEDRVRARAAKRGDIVAAEDSRNFLGLALSYYDRAQQPDKAQKVRDKARTLAKQHESKGEGLVAADYYAIAGDSTKASAVQKETEAREQKAEESRKKTFKKDQDDLEKALGF